MATPVPTLQLNLCDVNVNECGSMCAPVPTTPVITHIIQTQLFSHGKKGEQDYYFAVREITVIRVVDGEMTSTHVKPFFMPLQNPKVMEALSYQKDRVHGLPFFVQPQQEAILQKQVVEFVQNALLKDRDMFLYGNAVVAHKGGTYIQELMGKLGIQVFNLEEIKCPRIETLYPNNPLLLQLAKESDCGGHTEVPKYFLGREIPRCSRSLAFTLRQWLLNSPTAKEFLPKDVK
jgi:hypothetical protein